MRTLCVVRTEVEKNGRRVWKIVRDVSGMCSVDVSGMAFTHFFHGVACQPEIRSRGTDWPNVSDVRCRSSAEKWKSQKRRTKRIVFHCGTGRETMTGIQELTAAVTALGVTIRFNGTDMVLEPAGIIPDELEERLRQNKPALLAALQPKACWHCDGTKACDCVSCSPGLALVDGTFVIKSGPCVACKGKGHL
jgi:hypothetical protein